MKLLKPFIKHYDWGLTAPHSMVSSFAPYTEDDQQLYAESWWGSHALGPALTENEVPLTNIPFILKVLSVGKPLSLQLHPDKEHATLLHKSDPGNFPDTSDKPEIVVALSNFTALCGFSPTEEVLKRTETLPIKHFEDIFNLEQITIQNLIGTLVQTNSTIAKLAQYFPHVLPWVILSLSVPSNLYSPLGTIFSAESVQQGSP